MADNTKDTAGSDQKGVEIHDLEHELTLDEMSYKAGGLSAFKHKLEVIKGEDLEGKHKDELDIPTGYDVLKQKTW